jgi:hypothetical protein
MKNALSIILGLLTLVLIVLLAVIAINIGFILVSSFIGIFISIVLLSTILFFALFAGAIFWLWMFIDCLKRENYKEENDKVVWVIVLLLASMIGAILYFFLVKRALKEKPGKGKKRQKR